MEIGHDKQLLVGPDQSTRTISDQVFMGRIEGEALHVLLLLHGHLPSGRRDVALWYDRIYDFKRLVLISAVMLAHRFFDKFVGC